MTPPPSRRSTQARGFLFADLRGYTKFVEARGDEAAAELLRTYRGIVRSVIGRFDGAEIRTEGDSFYVVFPSASDAILAGLAILDEGVPVEGGPIGIGVGLLTAAGLVFFRPSLTGQAQQQTSPTAAPTPMTTSTAAPSTASPEATAEEDSRAEHEDRLRARIDPDVARICVSADPEEAPGVDVGPNQIETLVTLGGLRRELG